MEPMTARAASMRYEGVNHSFDFVFGDFGLSVEVADEIMECIITFACLGIPMLLL